jgi:ribonuclease HII
LALHRAFQALCDSYGICAESEDNYLIMDGKAVIPDYRRESQRAIIKGDGQSAAIAAASVVAKHHRDNMIKVMATEYPGYDWEENMGYGTPAHLKGIRELGVTPQHRRNFKRVHEQLLLTLE